MIILIGSEKGGAGKTTVATNIVAMLAMNGRDVLLLDTDTQATSTDWGFMRDEHPELARVTVLQKTGAVNKEIAKLVTKYDDIVIDAGGRDSEEMRSALLVAHVWYIPIRASQFDVWTIAKNAKVFEQMANFNPELHPKVLVNGASTHVNHDDRADVLEVLEPYSDLLHLSDACLCDRSAYRKAAGLGCAVLELKGRDFDKKAAQEMENLYEEIINHG